MLYLHQVASLRVYATQFYIRSKYYKVTLVAISFFWVVCLSILLLSLFRAKTIFEMSKSPFREEASSTTLLCPRMVVRQIGKDPIFCSIKNQIRFDCNLFASDQSKNSYIALQYNHIALHHITLHSVALNHITIQYNTVHSTLQYNTMHNAIQ